MNMPTEHIFRITLIGAGTIGLSFAALYLKQSKKYQTHHQARQKYALYYIDTSIALKALYAIHTHSESIRISILDA
jgi:hypothetical protein